MVWKRKSRVNNLEGFLEAGIAHHLVNFSEPHTVHRWIICFYLILAKIHQFLLKIRACTFLRWVAAEVWVEEADDDEATASVASTGAYVWDSNHMCPSTWHIPSSITVFRFLYPVTKTKHTLVRPLPQSDDQIILTRYVFLTNTYDWVLDKHASSREPIYILSLTCVWT